MKQPLIIPIWQGRREVYQNVSDWGFLDRDHTYTVPEGFVCDGASVPRLLWPFMPPDGRHRAAALAHDWLYVNKGRMMVRAFTRADCDRVFLRLMLAAGIRQERALLAWAGVRLGGWWPWLKPQGDPIVLPVRNEAPTIRRKAPRLSRHLYAMP